MKLPIGPTDFYEVLPPTHHVPGDIWSDLPTHGVLPFPFTPGLVITPACDLANRKVDTATYLPVVSLRAFFTSRAMLPELLKKIDGQAQAAGVELGLHLDWQGLPPSNNDVAAAISLITEHRSAMTSHKKTEASHRAEAGLRLVSDILNGLTTEPSLPRIKHLMGEKEYTALCRTAVTNALRSDIHFLPPDEQPAEWSLVRVPSVALFRYPLSIPIDILDLAGSSTEAAWAGDVTRFEPLHRCASAVQSSRPLKVLRIRPRFMSDLLTRFTGLYGRIGSPDFSPGSVDRYVGLVDGGQP